MNVEAVINTYMRDPYFSERIYEFEYIYMSTYHLESSPLIHCSNKQKAMVLSTILDVHVRTISNDHDILGRTIISVVYKNYSYPYFNGME